MLMRLAHFRKEKEMPSRTLIAGEVKTMPGLKAATISSGLCSSIILRILFLFISNQIKMSGRFVTCLQLGSVIISSLQLRNIFKSKILFEIQLLLDNAPSRSYCCWIKLHATQEQQLRLTKKLKLCFFQHSLSAAPYGPRSNCSSKCYYLRELFAIAIAALDADVSVCVWGGGQENKLKASWKGLAILDDTKTRDVWAEVK